MKRENFNITLNGEHFGTRHTFNACTRSIVLAVRGIAKEREQTFHLVKQSGTKEGFGHVEGIRVWQSVDKILLFAIKKERSDAHNPV